MFSVLWSEPRLYNEKPRIIDSSVQLEVRTVPVECPVGRRWSVSNSELPRIRSDLSQRSESEWSKSSAVKEEGFGWRFIVIMSECKGVINKSNHPIETPFYKSPVCVTSYFYKKLLCRRMWKYTMYVTHYRKQHTKILWQLNDLILIDAPSILICI
jgi:hypothetical protein